MAPTSSGSLGADRFMSSGELYQDGKERKSGQERANRENKEHCSLTKSCFWVGQYAVGFMCIISLDLYGNTMKEQILSPFSEDRAEDQSVRPQSWYAAELASTPRPSQL